MKFLRRKVHGTETVREEGRIIQREIEITVEQEWFSVPSAGRGEGSMQDAAPATQVELPPLELPQGIKLE